VIKTDEKLEECYERDIFICSNHIATYIEFVIVIGCTQMLELHIWKFVITSSTDWILTYRIAYGNNHTQLKKNIVIRVQCAVNIQVCEYDQSAIVCSL
jgi:hypothetical protein